MKIENKSKVSSEVVTHAMALARTHCVGKDERCRSYRWRAATRRVVCVAVMLVMIVGIPSRLAANAARRPSTEGVLPVGEATQLTFKILKSL